MNMIKKSIRKKIALMCILLAAVICTGICISGYYEYRNSTFETYNSFAYEMAYTALSFVDGDTIASYLESGETDEAYDKMASQIKNLYDNTSLSAIYICVPNAENMTVTTIYDVRIHEAEKPEIYALGVVDPIGASSQTVVDIYRTGQLADDYFIRKNTFGYNTSAIIPVKDSGGGIQAILVVDVPMPFIQQNLRAYLLSTIIVTVVLVSVLMLGFLSYLRKNVVNPIRLITENAAAFADNREGFSEETLRITTGDEIETLARALGRMETDINEYIVDLAQVTADKERIATELSVATEIQSSMLPCIFPAFPERPEFDIYATMHAAKEVGGDFYDFFLVGEGRLCVVMADVSGKGVPAALFMVIAKTLLKNYAQLEMEPSDVFETVNNQLCESNDAGMFVTAFMGMLDLSTGRFAYVNAGHNPPLIARSGGAYEWLQTRPGFVLAGMEEMSYQQDETVLGAGDRLFLYTDGVTEALNRQEELYTEDRLIKLFNSGVMEGHTIAEILKIVRDDITLFADGAEQADDITMLMLKISDTMRPAPVSEEQSSEPWAELRLPAEPDRLDEVLDFVNGQLESAGFLDSVITQADLAVEEIFVNVAHYAYEPEQGEALIRCAVTGTPSCASIEISDWGRPYNPLEKEDPDITLSAEERQIGGLGIFMVKNLMDGVTYEYRDGKNILTMKKQNAQAGSEV